MLRNSFLRFVLAAGSAALIPVKNFAGQFRFNRDAKGYKVDAGKDRMDKPLSLMEGDSFFTKVGGADTDGDMYIFESTRVKEGGPSFHVHHAQDEWWYVISGEFLFKVGDKDFTAKQGDFVFGPRGVPHAFCKTGEGEARLMMGFQPAGKMEAFFKLSAEGVLKNMTEEEREVLRQQHGFTRVGPPIKNLKI